ncbi:MAG: bifunctional diaminohydroxyphosphoribosylaminopyrimidine deaminase/5-amino-6-(5-phosphoribosylamino)uracil reductase RibD [Acidobacteria bacterium]|nr:bifunctional diaminohydroxyphosphoribosylaminopyrimidine deaminase/5-amino-6-(5-phosphoribosylamino)uracil reductase RibD [Acidobacteriota bacterium]
MRRALTHARRGLGRTAPNPVVGACVVTGDGIVVGDGAHERAGEPHAEVFALEEAGPRARGATLYCTLEPCAHTGRTGPCADRIIAAGIRRVVAAMEDPHPLVSGRGFAALRRHGVQVDVGAGREPSIRLNQPCLTAVREGRPFVILKAATSLDGRLAAAEGTRTLLTSAPAAWHAHEQRAQVDAVAIGSATLLADDPLLTVRHVYRERPLARVIFDRRLRAAPDARVFSTLSAGPVIILTSEAAIRTQRVRAEALQRAGATLEAVDEPTMIGALQALARRDLQSVLLEGGTAVHQAAWDEGVVDYMQLYVAPAALGPAGLPLAAGPASAVASLVEPCIRVLGPDVLIEGYVHRPH